MSAMLLCLATEKGLRVLEAAVSLRPRRPFVVCTFKETNVLQSFDQAIRDQARAAEIPLLAWADFRQDPIGTLQRHEIDGVLCIGWRYLVPDHAVRHLGGNVVIAHDALLPKLRGFAPLPTALIIGEQETGVTFLRAGASVDDGDILWQGRITIDSADTIADLIHKVGPLYVEGALCYLRGELSAATPQDHRQATYSIWRDELDYRLDWSKSAERLERTIRALGPPYLGAQTNLGGQVVVVERAELAPDLPFAIRQPGKVWSLDDAGRPTVVCGAGMLKITAASRAGQSILPLKSLRQRFTGQS